MFHRNSNSMVAICHCVVFTVLKMLFHRPVYSLKKRNISSYRLQTDFIRWLHTKREYDYFLLTRALYMLRLTSADDWQLLPTIHQHWSQNIDNAIIQILKEFLYDNTQMWISDYGITLIQWCITKTDHIVYHMIHMIWFSDYMSNFQSY